MKRQKLVSVAKGLELSATIGKVAHATRYLGNFLHLELLSTCPLFAKEPHAKKLPTMAITEVYRSYLYAWLAAMSVEWLINVPQRRSTLRAGQV